MNLIVVESPTKARTLSRFLGGEYLVEATMGHIKDLPKSELAVDVEHDFEPKYVPVEKKKDVINKIKETAVKASVIYIATDPDREGEAIVQHVKDVLTNDKLQIPNDKLKRIVFHEITKEAVEEAISHPRGIDKNLVDAQIGRRVLDRLVGYKLSPLLWKSRRCPSSPCARRPICCSSADQALYTAKHLGRNLCLLDIGQGRLRTPKGDIVELAEGSRETPPPVFFA